MRDIEVECCKYGNEEEKNASNYVNNVSDQITNR